MTFGTQPGRDDLILGRAGLGAPRVPTSITTPGGGLSGDRVGRRESRHLQPAPIPQVQLYGTMELTPKEYEGPAQRFDTRPSYRAHSSIGTWIFRAKYLEIPQARADVLTASLAPIRSCMPTASLFPTERIRFGSRPARRSTT